MNTHFNYNFVAKTIVGSKRSISRANKGLNPEYAELCSKLADHPDFKVVEKVINQNTNKKTYQKLTLDRMRDYISLLSNSEERLAELEAVIQVAEARSAKYPLTKKWFLATYPEFKENVISADQTKALINADALKKANDALANLTLSDEDLLEEEESTDDFKDVA